MPREPGKKYIGGFRASQNRLNLLKHVQADYFTFLDGDDYFDDERKLQKQINILESAENQDCAACGHAIDAEYPDGTRKPFLRIANYQDKYDLSEYWKGVYCSTDTILARSSTISNVPFELVENSYNDILITFLILQSGKLYYLPETMAIYRQTGDGVWTSGNTFTNNLRNMMVYDLAVMINPKMKNETQLKFASTWRNLYSRRKEIYSDEHTELLAEARDKGLKNTRRWIEYNSLDANEKAELMMQYWVIRMRSIGYNRGIRKIKRIMHLSA